MKYDFKKVIEDNKKIDSTFIKNLNDLYNKYPNVKIVIELSSTKNISSTLLKQLPENLLIRVSGGYDEERVKRNAKITYKDGEKGTYYEEAVIYTRNELIKIIEEIEKIERGYNRNWSNIQKVIYTYDKLKREIMYDPKYEHKPSSETRSLRGLVTKETVCAGYSLIFKEIMDRNDIECEYVEGHTHKDGTGAHSWNIVIIDGKKYPIDLTKDNTLFRAGKMSSISSFTQDIETFSNGHFPYKEEKTKNYKETLTQMDPQIVDLIIEQISKSREYEKTTYYVTRTDGTRFMVTEIGNATANDTQFFRYCYSIIEPDGKMTPPIILYSENNVTALMYGKLHGKKIPADYENAINNILFSKENIHDSLVKGTFYIGRVDKIINQNKRLFVSSYKEINKPENISRIFYLPTKIFTRSDGTSFIVQKISPKQYKIAGYEVITYDIVEIINNNNKTIVKRNSIFTEKDFLNIDNQNIADEYLSRERLDIITEEFGGYAGYLDKDDNIKYHQEILSFFNPLDKIDLKDSENKTKNKRK